MVVAQVFAAGVVDTDVCLASMFSASNSLWHPNSIVARGLRCTWHPSYANSLTYCRPPGPPNLLTVPEGPCTQIVDTLALKYLNRDYFKAKVYIIWVHGPLGIMQNHAYIYVLWICKTLGLTFRV